MLGWTELSIGGMNYCTRMCDGVREDQDRTWTGASRQDRSQRVHSGIVEGGHGLVLGSRVPLV